MRHARFCASAVAAAACGQGSDLLQRLVCLAGLKHLIGLREGLADGCCVSMRMDAVTAAASSPKATTRNGADRSLTARP